MKRKELTKTYTMISNWNHIGLYDDKQCCPAYCVWNSSLLLCEVSGDRWWLRVCILTQGMTERVSVWPTQSSYFAQAYSGKPQKCSPEFIPQLSHFSMVMARSVGPSFSGSFGGWVGRSVRRSVGRSVGGWVGLSITGSFSGWVGGSVGPSFSGSFGGWVSRSVCRSVGRSVGGSVCRSVGWSVGLSLRLSFGGSVIRWYVKIIMLYFNELFPLNGF